MNFVLKTLSRVLLIAGVLVALTPCGLCHKDMGSTACSMKSMASKMDCCHKSKPVSPLCKVMDQSSTVSAAKHLVVTPVVAVHVVAAPVMAFARTIPSSSSVLDTSPFRAPLSLRI